ncbi:unnamed protein product [Schistocephalus solidus]|uniref:Uncharacterized protein n=1 Tax=Schistocephalus solidus TaxID=70667 RepID=A0A3P7F3N7_SCHSO|nr:unnamed protein product [Schistocephalus solidus]
MELILRHWPWLVATLDPVSGKQASRHLSLREMEAYVEEFQQNQLHSSPNPELSGTFDEGDASRLISPIVATAAADPAVPAESAIREVRALFNRAQLFGPYSDPTASKPVSKPVAKPDKQTQQSATVEQDENGDGDGGVDLSCCSVTVAGDTPGGSSVQKTHF